MRLPISRIEFVRDFLGSSITGNRICWGALGRCMWEEQLRNKAADFSPLKCDMTAVVITGEYKENKAREKEGHEWFLLSAD